VYQFYQKLVQRAFLQIEDALSTDEDREKAEDRYNKLNTFNNFLLDQVKPLNFDGEDSSNAQVNQQNSFASVCASLEELGVIEPDKLTAYKFYSKVSYYKKQAAKQKALAAQREA
jgi:hypothetical protein